VGDAYPCRTATTSTGDGQPPVLPTPAPPPPSLPCSLSPRPALRPRRRGPPHEAAAGHGGEFCAGPTSSAPLTVESTSSYRAGPTNSSPLWPNELQAGGQAHPTPPRVHRWKLNRCLPPSNHTCGEWRSDSCPELLNPGVRAPLLSSPTYACVRLHGSSPSGAATRDSTTGRRRSCLHRRAPPLLFSPAHHCLRAAEEVSGSRSWPGGALAKPAQAETSSPSVSSYAAQTPHFAQLKPG
jgi:hypothetical protein